MNLTAAALLLLLFPLIAFVLLGLSGKNRMRKSGPLIATIFQLLSFGAACYIAWQYFFVIGKADGSYSPIEPLNHTWLRFTSSLSIDMGVLLDPVSVMMIVVVTFISLAVNVYSTAYMKGDGRVAVFFSFLGLFTFSMLGLVISSNIFQMYIFWELVGVSSFLLIGYYYDRPSAVAACKKAFIVTRFADLGFLIGILIVSFYAGTFDLTFLVQKLADPSSPELMAITGASFAGISALTWGLALIFIGGAGKSAMFPLHIWLPDAMEGPTPVSALIHAATMVVAGVFLVARLFPIFSITGFIALEIVEYVGAFSALLAAVIACTQTDIKRILAFSTMSQIGFMMLALGASSYGAHADAGYSSSMFHLFTHAMFKALLFLLAGVVIHFVHSNEIDDMGGLRKQLPLTHICFLVACLAISGVPPFAGFFSKEAILNSLYEQNRMFFWVALLTSALTAFYMFRLYFTVFWNKAPQLKDAHGEGSMAIKLPLVVLALCTLFTGFIPFGNFVNPAGKPVNFDLHLSFAVLPVVLSVAGIVIAFLLYKTANNRPARIATAIRPVYLAVRNKFFIDELYAFITKKIIFQLIGKPAAWVDRNIVDGVVNLTGKGTQSLSNAIKAIQSGKVQHYAFWFLAGVIALIMLFIL